MISSKLFWPAHLFVSIFKCFCIILVLILPASKSQLVETSCGNTGNYTTNSTYQANFKALLPSLSTNASISSGFFNSSVGRYPDRIYGLALCRGDINTTTCLDCLHNVGEKITTDCPNNMAAVIWHDQCMLRYSNRIFFSSPETEPTSRFVNAQTFTETDTMLLRDLSARVVDTVVNDRLFFGTGEVAIDRSLTMYGLAQCSRDLSSSNCDACLSTISADIRICCSKQRGARILAPSCNFRFELYLFYDESLLVTQPPSPAVAPPPQNSAKNSTSGSKTSSERRLAVVIVPVVIAAAVVASILWAILRKKTRKTYDGVAQGLYETNVEQYETNVELYETNVESFKFALDTIIIATNNFCEDNKLGKGGFGTVYKGVLPEGQEIAVKRLSKGSGQGVQEFKTEVAIVVKLQHRSLVRLLGCCAEGEEKILVYEYVPNKSLDYFLFDQKGHAILDWTTRWNIIQGIARGLLYIHEDSRLKIVHRDLKASNVLLDGEMYAKIADFGLARMFGVDQSQGNTNRIAGTHGYMAPEYVFRGIFSVKSDVYSFGVLLLEILSGQKSTNFYQSENTDVLSSHYIWKKWSEGEGMEIIHPSLRGNSPVAEVLRCMHIALLCLQDSAEDRPAMSTVNLMLNSNSMSLPVPAPPAFFMAGQTKSDGMIPTPESWEECSFPDHSTTNQEKISHNEVTMTEFDPR